MKQQVLNKYPELVLMDFCQDNNYEYLDEFKNTIIACRYEVTEDYYGAQLIQPIIVAQWSFDDFDKYLTDWWFEFCEREDKVGSYLGSLGLI